MSTATSTSTKLQRYQRGEPLGTGGQGCTYRALDTESGRRVALKVIELRGASGWKPFDLFERECRVLSALKHPGIPQCLDTFADEQAGTYYLVMDLVEGESLREVLLRGVPLDEEQLWRLLGQALEILEYLHGRLPPVIHRDVKPANLIRRADGELSLVDFGGVRVALQPEGGSTVVGTFGYMAPEQLHGEARPATDIYSLGATLAALATGTEADRLPRRGLRIDLEQTMAPSPLRAVLLAMLEPDPERRLASCAAVRQAAEQALAEKPLPDEDDAQDEPWLQEVEGPLGALIRALGVVGYVGLSILEAVVLPLVFIVLKVVLPGGPGRRARLSEHKRTVRKAMREGRHAMRALTRRSSARRSLAPPAWRMLPPPWSGRRRRRGR